MGKLENKAAIYVRKSSKDSREGENRSLAAQIKDCQELATRHGLEVVHIYQEEVGVSASHIKNHDRPVLDDFLNGFGSEFGVGIAWAFDRITRKGMAEAGTIIDRVIEAKGRLLTFSDGIDTDDERQRLVLAIRSEMSRDEIATMTKRVARGKDGQRSRGELLGGKPTYGLTKDPEAPYGVSLVPEEVKVVQEMVARILDGDSMTDATKWANAQGYTTREGAQWRRCSVDKLFRNPYLLGHRYYPKHDETFCDEDGNPVQVHDPIIKEADFYRLQKRINKKPHGNRKFQRVDPSPLFGIAKCACCGDDLYYPVRYDQKIENPKRKLNDKVVEDRYVKCMNDLCKSRASTYFQLFHDYVINQALSFIATLEPDSEILDEVGRRWMGTTSPEIDGLRASLEDRLDVLAGKLANLRQDFYESEAFDRDQFKSLEKGIEENISEVREDLSHLPEKELDISPLLDLTQFDADGETAFSKLSINNQIEVLNCIIDEVTVAKGETKVAIKAPLEDRVTIKFVTESNVYELAQRKPHSFKEVAVAAS
jgi:DNA invertase Pin-like site-specific DNA recombinase